MEEKVVGRLREDEVDELLAVLVDVGRDPAPVAVANVVEILEAALTRQPVRLKWVFSLLPAARPLESQKSTYYMGEIRIMTLSEGSPYETLHDYVAAAVSL